MRSEDVNMGRLAITMDSTYVLSTYDSTVNMVKKKESHDIKEDNKSDYLSSYVHPFFNFLAVYMSQKKQIQNYFKILITFAFRYL